MTRALANLNTNELGGLVFMSSSGQIQYKTETDPSTFFSTLRKSTDYGVTWAVVSSLDIHAAYVAIDATGNVIYVSDATYLKKSVNGGTSWATVLTGTGINPREVATSVDGSLVVVLSYDGSANNVMISTTGGSSWVTTDWSGLFDATAPNGNIAISLTTVASIYIPIKYGTKGSPGIMLKYSWTYANSPTTGTWSDMNIGNYTPSGVAVTPDGSRILICTDGEHSYPGALLTSTNSGSSFTSYEPYGYSFDNTLLCMSANGAFMMAHATSGGNWTAFYSENTGTSWTPVGIDTPTGVACSIDGAYVTIGTLNAGLQSFNAPPPPLVPCFPTGALIATPEGYKPVETIKTGDMLLTSDGRQVPVKAFTTPVKVTTKENAPYVVGANAFGPANPPRDVRLSPWHAFQVAENAWQKPAIASLYSKQVFQYDLGVEVMYYHFEAPNYLRDNFVVNGAVVESYANDQLKGANPYTYDREKCVFTRRAVASSKSSITH